MLLMHNELPHTWLFIENVLPHGSVTQKSRLATLTPLPKSPRGQNQDDICLGSFRRLGEICFQDQQGCWQNPSPPPTCDGGPWFLPIVSSSSPHISLLSWSPPFQASQSSSSLPHTSVSLSFPPTVFLHWQLEGGYCFQGIL